MRFPQNLFSNLNCPKVFPRQDGGQILEQENVASTITGLEPCRLLFIDSGIQPYVENIGRFDGKHQERNK